MKIQLVKHYNNEGLVHYYVKVGDQIVEDSITYTLEGAMQAYERVKQRELKGKTVVLCEETI
jgi:hypothetical protein